MVKFVEPVTDKVTYMPPLFSNGVSGLDADVLKAMVRAGGWVGGRGWAVREEGGGEGGGREGERVE